MTEFFFLAACLSLAAVPRAAAQDAPAGAYVVAAASAPAPIPLVPYDAAGAPLRPIRPQPGRFTPASAALLSTSDAYAYPVPFRPHGPQAGTGPGRTGTDAEGITFVQLPPQGGVDVYNVRGEKVWHGDFSDGSGVMVWNTLAASGQTTASGVYIYVITGPQDKKIGKLAIIR